MIIGVTCGVNMLKADTRLSNGEEATINYRNIGQEQSNLSNNERTTIDARQSTKLWIETII